MAHRPIKRALIAVYDKTGVTEFARTLVDEFGVEIISTGGSARHLKEAGVPVTMVEQVTGFPEMLDGRVKTLHPKIHAAILADRDNPEHMRQLAEQKIEPIDMVVVNLYPFEKTVSDPNCKFEDAIEMIDIGGPCLLRAAAKNHKHVYVCSYIWKYLDALDCLRRWDDTAHRTQCLIDAAYDAFWTTNTYDLAVAEWLGQSVGESRQDISVIRLFGRRPLRYGENSHQVGAYFTPYDDTEANRLIVQITQSTTDISFNNLTDANSAFGLCAELNRADPTRRSAVFVKHTNACGVGIAANPADAYQRAYLGDPNAAMGGILAVNFNVTLDFAKLVMETYDRFGKAAGAGGFFVEVWLAPAFDDKAAKFICSSKKWGENVRLLDVGDMSRPPDAALEYKTIAGGMLVQTPDLIGLNEDQWKVVTKRPPTESEMNDLRLAWLISKHTKSNAISICKDGMLIGNGAGQMSRVMSCRIATWLAKENGHADKLKGSAAASDAFFPFRDGPDILIEAGVTALIQPGGSKRDADTIAACDERGIAMIHTGTRHFRH